MRTPTGLCGHCARSSHIPTPAGDEVTLPEHREGQGGQRPAVRHLVELKGVKLPVVHLGQDG